MMEHNLRFVVAAMQEVPWPEMIQRWQYLEAAGLDGAFLADHFVNYENPTAIGMKAGPCFLHWRPKPAPSALACSLPSHGVILLF